MTRKTIPEPEYVLPGHSACPGCGGTLAIRYMLKALGPEVIIAVPACCWAIVPGYWPQCALRVPVHYNAFEATGAAIAGLRAGLDALGRKGVTVVGFAGDGGTVDIGLQALSHSAVRNVDAIYVMYDNEAYMNTGVQHSGETPIGAWTTTTPVPGATLRAREPKKDIIAILAAHQIPYAATVSVGFPEDFVKKVQKAQRVKGLKFIHALTPCPAGWRFDSSKTIQVAKLAVDCGLFPLYEVENGRWIISRKTIHHTLDAYLKVQGRYGRTPPEIVQLIQQQIDAHWQRLLALEAFTAAGAPGSAPAPTPPPSGAAVDSRLAQDAAP